MYINLSTVFVVSDFNLIFQLSAYVVYQSYPKRFRLIINCFQFLKSPILGNQVEKLGPLHCQNKNVCLGLGLAVIPF